MMGYKLFTLEQARALLPSLRKMLHQAKDELGEKLESVHAANECYERAEEDLDRLGESAPIEALRSARACFQDAIQNLAVAQNAYVSKLNYWVDRIGETGVILRDLQDGLLDFPCEQNGFSYLLCWRGDEEDITCWHLANDGFIGRKPLSALSEFC